MTKLLFVLLPALALLGISSCTGDGCSFEGKWMVKNADLQSSTLDSNILNMTEQTYLTMSYEFAKDSVKINTGERAMAASWQLDESKQYITWSAMTPEGQEMKETSFVQSCTPGEIVLTQRLPYDTTQKELARITLTLEKGK